MKIIKYFIIATSFVLLILLSGCSEEPRYSLTNEPEVAVSVTNEPEIAVSASVPTSFILRGNSLIDFKNEMATRLSLSNYHTVDENDDDVSRNKSIRENNIFAHYVYEVASLTEFYFVTVEIDGIEWAAFEIDGLGVMYTFRCINSVEGNISIFIERYPRTDDSWPILIEQLTRDGRGHLTENDMIYQSGSRRISARIGDTRMSIMVSDNLNNYEFLRDLALEVIETSIPVVVEEGFFRRYL